MRSRLVIVPLLLFLLALLLPGSASAQQSTLLLTMSGTAPQWQQGQVSEVRFRATSTDGWRLDAETRRQAQTSLPSGDPAINFRGSFALTRSTGTQYEGTATIQVDGSGRGTFRVVDRARAIDWTGAISLLPSGAFNVDFYATAGVTPTATVVTTATPRPTATPVPTATEPPTATPTPRATLTPASTVTASPAPTPTATPEPTPRPAATATVMVTPTPKPTEIPPVPAAISGGSIGPDGKANGQPLPPGTSTGLSNAGTQPSDTATFQAPADHTYWYLARTAGLVAYLLVFANICLGLVLTTGAKDKAMPRWRTYDLHQFTAILGIAMLALHIFSLLGDKYFKLGIADLLVPFRMKYGGNWMALGVIGFYLTLVVTASFYVRRFIGQRTWRTMHYLSFAIFVMVLCHGAFAGTDTTKAWVSLIYVSSGCVVTVLTVVRVMKTRAARKLRFERLQRKSTGPARQTTSA